MKLNYRADIDGLRAVAVLSVLLYHAGASVVSGGFVGVDVFFVISGYLITTIIMREINGNKFSLAKFYERRIRRIYPALFAILPFTIGISAFLYDPSNFRNFGKSLIATTFFFSNIHFWTDTGYFEGPTELKPLLHTWSLAVEEQFYIFFPLMVMLIARYFKSRISHILAGITLLLFSWNIYAMQNDPSGAFYFAHLRAWELLIGSVLALNPVSVRTKPAFRNVLSLIGLGMISAPIFLYSENTAFPGFAATVPAFGTALIIYSGIANLTLVNKLLSFPPLVFVGKISYSLYLWHWPLIIFTTYYAIRKLTRPELVLLLMVIFIVSSLSWQFIEKPFRIKTLPGKTSIFLGAGTVMLITAAIGSIIYFNGGFPNRQNTEQMADENETWVYEPCNFTDSDNDGALEFCTIGAEMQTPSFLVWGDSHASALTWGIHLSASQNGIAGQLIYGAGCPPLLGIASNRKSTCIDFNDTVLQYIEDHPELDTIFLAGRWAQWAEGTGYKENIKNKLIDTLSESSKKTTNAILLERGLNRTVEELLALDRKVIIISQVPEIKYNVASSNFIAQRTGRDVNRIIAPSLDEYLSRNQKVFLAINSISKDNIQVIDPWKALCNEQQCFVVVDEKPLYMDADHLSLFGSEYISHIYDPIFEESAKTRK